MGKKEKLKRGADGKREGTYASIESDRNCFGKVGILEGRDMEVRTAANVVVCDEDVLAITHETWSTSGREESEGREGDRRGGGDGVLKEWRAEAVNGFEGFVVCGGFVLRRCGGTVF